MYHHTSNGSLTSLEIVLIFFLPIFFIEIPLSAAASHLLCVLPLIPFGHCDCCFSPETDVLRWSVIGEEMLVLSAEGHKNSGRGKKGQSWWPTSRTLCFFSLCKYVSKKFLCLSWAHQKLNLFSWSTFCCLSVWRFAVPLLQVSLFLGKQSAEVCVTKCDLQYKRALNGNQNQKSALKMLFTFSP